MRVAVEPTRSAQASAVGGWRSPVGPFALCTAALLRRLPQPLEDGSHMQPPRWLAHKSRRQTQSLAARAGIHSATKPPTDIQAAANQLRRACRREPGWWAAADKHEDRLFWREVARIGGERLRAAELEDPAAACTGGTAPQV